VSAQPRNELYPDVSLFASHNYEHGARSLRITSGYTVTDDMDISIGEPQGLLSEEAQAYQAEEM